MDNIIKEDDLACMLKKAGEPPKCKFNFFFLFIFDYVKPGYFFYYSIILYVIHLPLAEGKDVWVVDHGGLAVFGGFLFPLITRIGMASWDTYSFFFFKEITTSFFRAGLCLFI